MQHTAITARAGTHVGHHHVAEFCRRFFIDLTAHLDANYAQTAVETLRRSIAHSAAGISGTWRLNVITRKLRTTV